jgi:Family of unknown function (DUF6319)
MNTPDPLSEQDLAAARAELAAGRPFPVWFTAAAVGVPVGGSAKIVSVGEITEGDFIEVRPTGSRDTVFCSPNELTKARPPRKRAQQAPPQPAAPQLARQRAPQGASARPESPVHDEAPEKSGAPVAEAERRPGRARAARPESPAHDEAPEKSGAPVAEAERRPGRARAARPAEVTVTLCSTADGEWTVEVTTGRKRTVRPTPVQPAEVAKAARSLPAAVTEAIESSLAAARQRQAQRVERLRAELDAAQRALHELSG